jgi:FtsH-binding integral membrane protein
MTPFATTEQSASEAIDEGLRSHMNKVYGSMSVGLMLTFLVSWAVGSNPDLFSLLRNPETLKPNILGFAVMFAPLAMILFIPMAMRLSGAAVRTLFYLFSAVMGLSMSWIFVAYTSMSIAQVFLVTSISFASLSMWGYVTKKDISGWGSFLFMGLIGIIVASILNIFIASSALSFAVTIIGLLVFAGLTAYDTQKIKNTYLEHAHMGNKEWLDKSATMGALDLYLDFINLFMMLLSLLGKRE